ncbi:MAG: hypothetical protein V1875_07000 [Candidatus Altiarchaeota archaeon]
MSLMDSAVIFDKLLDVDRRLHSIMEELNVKKRKALPLSELNRLMGDARLTDEDSSEIIRKMRDREYGA